MLEPLYLLFEKIQKIISEHRDLAGPEEPLEDIGPELRLRLSIFPKIPESKYCKIFYTDSGCFSIKTPASLTIRP